MKLKWFKNCKDSEKAAVKQQIKNAKPVLDRLKVLLEEELEASVKGMAPRHNFDSPDWSSKMAHYLGEQTALRSIIETLSIEEK